MKKVLLTAILLTAILTGCTTPTDLADMTSYSTEGTGASNVIEWNGVQYYMYGIGVERLMSKQIGVVDGNSKHRVYEVKGYSSAEWIIEKYHSGEMDVAMLWKEKSVESIPVELEKYKYKDIYLTFPQSEFPLMAETIPFTIINELGEDIPITLIPKLERIEGENLIEIPFADVGFCGTPDTIRERYDGEIQMSWWGDNLTAGTYQLSYTLYDSEVMIAEIFELK